MLDGSCSAEKGEGLVGAHAREALDVFLKGVQRSSGPHHIPGVYAVDRDEVYEDYA
jgi:hypothetical protein